MPLANLRQMADYPRVDANNSYLLARYDGTIIDGKPWGLGRVSREHPVVRKSEKRAEQCLNKLEVRFLCDQKNPWFMD